MLKNRYGTIVKTKHGMRKGKEKERKGEGQWKEKDRIIVGNLAKINQKV